MSAFFVTATGTDIGKTFVTAGLIRHLGASAIKPVVSGFDMAAAATSDPGVLLSAMGRPVTEDEITRISPWRFAAPLSPDLAASREGRIIDFDTLVEFSRDAIARAEGTLFTEGVGGIMAPLTRRHTVLDWMAALQIPLIVVTGSYLGAISHTLTALDVLRRRDLTVATLVVNESAGGTVSLADTAEAVGRFTPGTPIVALPRLSPGASSHPAFGEVARHLAIDRR